MKARGFTLLEIMIALAVFAIASAALIKNASQSVRQAAVLEERVLAAWVAENELNALRRPLRVDDDFPAVGVERVSVTMAEREWDVVIETNSTENESVQRVEVRVFKPNDNVAVVTTLTGFVGRY